MDQLRSDRAAGSVGIAALASGLVVAVLPVSVTRGGVAVLLGAALGVVVSGSGVVGCAKAKPAAPTTDASHRL
jgi:hypothetical protein